VGVRLLLSAVEGFAVVALLPLIKPVLFDELLMSRYPWAVLDLEAAYPFSLA
jgi:hypothetical protein